MVAERFAAIGWPFRLLGGKPGQSKREDVSEDMSCIGEQGQGVSEPAADNFCGQNDQGQKKGQTQHLLRHTMRVTMPRTHADTSLSWTNAAGNGSLACFRPTASNWRIC